jgi:hypothetical protein
LIGRITVISRVHRVVGRRIVQIAYLLFLGWFVYAAAAYGLTRDDTLHVFEWGMGGTVALWLLGHAVERAWPRTGVWPWVFALAVLGFGWAVTGLGVFQDWATGESAPDWAMNLPEVLLTGWSTYDPALSLAAMTRTTVLLGAMLLAIDLWNDPRFRKGLLLTMVLSSFGMVVFFLLQRVVGPPFLLVGLDGKSILSFATYRYWGNAAAYLNLFWPVTVGIALFAALRRTSAWPLWLIPAVGTFLACFLNVSKAGNVLAIIGFFLLLALLAPIAARELRRLKRRIKPHIVLGALIPILILVILVPFALPWKRWDYLADRAMEGSPDARMHAYMAFTKMVPVASWAGFGPGTFSKYYGHYVKDDPSLRHVPFWVAHQDYLQTVIEWGYIGAALWALVLVPPVLLLFAAARRRAERPTREFEGYRITVFDYVKVFVDAMPSPREPCVAAGALCAVILTALHAMVDFPMQIASLQLDFLTLLALGWSYRLKDREAEDGADAGI